MTRTALLAALLATPLAADPVLPLDAEAFEAHVSGRTLVYSRGGLAYGVERYLRDRRVLWAFIGGECHHGFWYQKGAEICFSYETLPGEQCWLFRMDGGGLRANYAETDDSYEISESGETAELDCAGPMIGT